MAWNKLADGDYPLSSDTVYTIPIDYVNSAGNQVGGPSGDVFTAAASGAFAASLGVSVGVSSKGAPAIVLTPMVAESDAGNSGGGIGVMITDSAGLTEDSADMAVKFDIVNPANMPTGFVLNIPGVEMASQPVPTATGP